MGPIRGFFPSKAVCKFSTFAIVVVPPLPVAVDEILLFTIVILSPASSISCFLSKSVCVIPLSAPAGPVAP